MTSQLHRGEAAPAAARSASGPHLPLAPGVNAPAAPRPTATSAARLPPAGLPAAGERAQVPDAQTPAAALISATGICKSYYKAHVEIPVLRGVDLEVHEGEFLAIIGQSGSGKSTLLHLLATLDAPDAGEVRFDGHRIDNLAAAGRDILRNRYFGMIFQFYHLLPELTTLENVLMPLMIAQGFWAYRARRREYRNQALGLLEAVGLSHRLKHKPRELSGGEMQRAAIARALIAQPRVLFADEPTGNLDRENGEETLRILRTLNAQRGLTIVMVTHDQSIADRADRTVRLVQGRVQRA